MNESLPEELLSAYLDGELPAEDRARVEHWLLENPANRRLYDDLAALRREVQALPSQSLDSGFSDRVLTAIRSRTEPPSSKGEVSDVTVAAKPAAALGMPAWRWFAAGVAATLAVVILGINLAPRTLTQIGLLPRVESQVPAATTAPQPKSSPVATAPAEPLYGDSRQENVEVYEAPAAAIMADQSPQAGAPVAAGDSFATRDDLAASKEVPSIAGDRADAKPGATGPQFGSAGADFRSTAAARREKIGRELPEEAAASDARSSLAAKPAEGQKSIGQWLDEAVARDGEAVLQLDLAIHTPDLEVVAGFANAGAAPAPSAPAPPIDDGVAKAKASAEPQLEEYADAGEMEGGNELEHGAEVENAVEIIGTREEVERLLAGLGNTEVRDAYFLAAATPGAQGMIPATHDKALSRTRKAIVTDKVAENQRENEAAAQPATAEPLQDTSPPPAAAAAKADENADAEVAEKKELNSAKGAAGGMKQRSAMRGTLRSLSAQDAPQQLRVRVRLFPTSENSSAEPQPAGPERR